MEPQHLDLRADEGAEAGDGLVDLAGARDEHERIAALLGAGAGGGAGEVVEVLAGHAPLVEPRAGRRCEVRAQLVQSARHLDHRGAVQQGGDGGRVEGRGHGPHQQVLPQLAGLGEHAQQQVRVQRALVHLVEQHRAHPRQGRIGEQAPQQHPGGEHLEPRARPDLALPADGEADGPAEGAAVELGDPAGGGAHGDAAGLGDQGGARSEVRDQRRDQGGLAGAGRGGDHERAGSGGRLELGAGGGDGQARADAVEVEAVAGHVSR